MSGEMFVSAPGYVADLDEDVYHGDPVAGGSLSHSIAKTLLQPGGPARWKWDHDRGVRYCKRAWDLGSAVHSYVLGAGCEVREIPADILASNGATSTREARQFIADARAANAVALKPTEFAQAQDMAAAVLAHPRAAETLTGTPELSGFAATPLGWLRCRWDMHTDAGGVDLKTTTDASPAAFAKRAVDYGYALQDAIYRWVDRLLGTPRPEFVFVQVEKEAPYLCSFVELSGELRAYGDDQAQAALELWHKCLAADTWPGYPSETVTVDSLPGFLRPRPLRHVDVREAAALVGCSETTIRRRIDDGTLMAALVGGRWRIPDRQLAILGVHPRDLRTTTPAALDPDIEAELMTLLDEGAIRD